MPYDSNAALPEAVRKALPEHGQSIWRAAFNSGFDGTCAKREDREGCAAAIAWAAVKRSYAQNDEGEWHPIKHQVGCRGPECLFGHVRPKTSHRAVGQTLEAWHKNAQLERDLFYSVDNFTGTEADWNVVPLIYAQSHPDPRLVWENLDGALDGIRTAEGKRGKVCGYLAGTEIIRAGQPRMEHEVVFDDPGLEAAYENGELSLSSCFVSTSGPDGRLTGKVRPNHMLVFRRDSSSPDATAVPGDPGAMFLHSRGGEMSENEIGVLDSIRRLLGMETAADHKGKEMSEKQETGDPVPQAQGSAPVPPAQDKSTEGDDLRAEIQRLTDENRKLSEKIESDKRDADWAKTLEIVPPGLLKKEGAEAVLRKEFEANPVAFAHKMMRRAPAKGTEEEGSQFSHGGDPGTLATIREMHTISGRSLKGVK